MNNDGYDDVLVGADGYFGVGLGGEIGKVFAYSGLDGSILFELIAPGTETEFLGRSVSDIGDLNGDGFDDVLSGAVNSEFNGYKTGSVFAFSGADGSILERWDGEFNADRFGVAVANAGDTNGDGKPDLLVGADSADFGGPFSGAAYVYSGHIGQPDLSILNLIEFKTAEIECTNCTPNGPVIVAWSFRGPGPVSTPYGMAQVTPPYESAQLTADSDGVASARFDIPFGVAGRLLWAHGVDVNSATLLNPLATVIR